MKLLICLFTLFFLCSCYEEVQNIGDKPKFQVGDCIVYVEPNKEKWEKQTNVIHKIVEVGHKSYHIIAYDEKNKEYYESFFNTLSFWLSSDDYIKVNCPNE